MKLRDVWTQWMPFVVIAGVIAVLAALIAPAIQQARDAERKSTSRNTLKQMGLALHNYHDVYDCFPPGGVVNENDVAFHGWYTAIMTYMDGSPLYSRINLDYPWTDPENIHLFRLKIPVLLMPDVKESYTSDGFALLHYLGNPNVFHRNSSVKLKDMKIANMWLLGEAAGNYQPWGYPFNWRALGTRLNAGPDSYGRPTGDGAFLLMADGSVQFFKNDVDPEILQTMANAPPIAPAEAARVPDRRFEYADTTWKTTSLDLDENEDQGLYAVAWHDSSTSPRTVAIYPKGKAEWRPTTLEDLKQIVARYPEAQALSRVSLIDDAAAQVLQKMKQLEFLQADSIEVTKPGLAALKQLPRLRILRAGMSEDVQQKLREALPKCDLRNTMNTRTESPP